MDRFPPNSDLTHPSLLLQLKQDGPAREIAWTKFHDTYAPMIRAFARRMGARPQEMDDLVQEVLKSFFCVSPEFSYNPANGRFRGYLKTCVWNKFAAMRSRIAREQSAIEHFPEPADAKIEDVWNDVWETEKLHRALAIVRDRYSTNVERRRTFRAFELCTLLDRSVEQVAAELRINMESVRAAKSRVSKALKQTFDTFDDITG